jgi:hypothetical protein
MRQLALAAANYESATKRYPVASDGTTDLLFGQTSGGLGDAPAASDDGFSWHFVLLPYVEENLLYNDLQGARDRDEQQTGPFDPDLTTASGEHGASMSLSFFRCPTYSGPVTTSMGGVEAAISNYCAIVGTDVAERSAATWKTTPNWENGGLPSACWKTPNSQTMALAHGSCVDRGIGLRDMSDGISKTLILVESRETVINAWISGASTWVVAASPNALVAGGATLGRDSGDGSIAMLQAGSTAAARNGDGLAIKLAAGDVYLGASEWATGRDREWGPSSEHAGGVVIHAFADAHAQAISPDIDPTLYLRMVTRGDGDPYNPSGL